MYESELMKLPSGKIWYLDCFSKEKKFMNSMRVKLFS